MASIDDLNNNKNTPTLLCGDLNSVPKSGLYKFLLNGRVECMDVDAWFFSGQNKQTPEEMRTVNRRKQLSPFFLQKMTSLTDQCQYVEVVKRRFEMKYSLENPSSPSYNIQGLSGGCSREDGAYKELQSPFSYTQGSGIISHNFNFLSVYDHTNYNDYFPHIKEVSFFLETNCSNVDYIFYTQISKQKRKDLFYIKRILNLNFKDVKLVCGK